MTQLELSNLPELPQTVTLRKVAPTVWAYSEVVALWVIGSLARGKGDAYSDVDLGVAVKPESLDTWKAPTFIDETIFSGQCVGRTFIPFADDAFLHNLVLSNGDMLDFGVQSSERLPPQEPMIVLGCRSEALAQKLAENKSQATHQPTPASKEAIRQLIVGFWMNTHKHRKVLHRQLELLTTVGINAERSMLMRLWYVLATGNDFNQHRQGIHGLTAVVQIIKQSIGEQALAVTGMSLTSRDEICQAIEEIRDEVSRVGRALSEKLNFDYPTALEETVKRSWADFMAKTLKIED